MDGKLSTMYSSGSPETGVDNSETRIEFINKFQKAKLSISAGNLPKTLFSNSQMNRRIDSGNWQITCPETTILNIINREGKQQKLLIKEDMPGFIFESSRYEKQVYMAESTLGKKIFKKFKPKIFRIRFCDRLGGTRWRSSFKISN